jgi:choline kinase
MPSTAPSGARQTRLNALILAAGRGRRLWPFTADGPKCLLRLGEHSILAHQIRRLAAAGLDRITVVAGYGWDSVRREVQQVTPPGAVVDVVYNPFFDAADNLISLWAARSRIGSDVVVLNGDNLFHPQIPRLLHESSLTDGGRLLVQRPARFTDDDMKVHLDGDRLLRIGKELPAETCDTASIGLMRFAGTAADALQEVLEEAVRGDEAMRLYYLDCVQRLADGGVDIRCVDVGDLPWADIDTPADLQSVRDSLDRFDAPVTALRGLT